MCDFIQKTCEYYAALAAATEAVQTVKGLSSEWQPPATHLRPRIMIEALLQVRRLPMSETRRALEQTLVQFFSARRNFLNAYESRFFRKLSHEEALPFA